MILFVDSCVRAHSRTRQLARWVLERLDGPVEELRLYPGGRHEMLNETNKQEVMADLAAWLNALG